MNAEVIKLAIDTIQNKVPASYAEKSDITKVLREEFIEANGGSSKITYKSFRDHPELFAITETIVPYITREGLQGDEFFMNLVEYRNLALGDDEEFWTEDNSLFLVADTANGTQAVRRQRLNAGQKATITKTLKTIKVYEELNRLLSGRVDFDVFIERVGKSMMHKINNDAYTALAGITTSTAGLTSDYVKTGSFSEDVLLGVIDHVEAATGATAQIIGTRTALRKVATAVVSNEAKSDMYNIGLYGKFNGTNMIVAKQRHVVGSDSFILSDSDIYVIASDDKPIKVVDVGEGLLIDSDATKNQDLTKEYLYGQEYGVGLIVNGKLGKYTIA